MYIYIYIYIYIYTMYIIICIYIYIDMKIIYIYMNIIYCIYIYINTCIYIPSVIPHESPLNIRFHFPPCSMNLAIRKDEPELEQALSEAVEAEEVPPQWFFLVSMGISGSENGGTVPYKAIFCGDIPLHRPYIGLIHGRYLQFRILKWPLMV